MEETNISVPLCTYNRAKYLEEQLDSILKQTVLPARSWSAMPASKIKRLALIGNEWINFRYFKHSDSIIGKALNDIFRSPKLIFV